MGRHAFLSRSSILINFGRPGLHALVSCHGASWIDIWPAHIIALQHNFDADRTNPVRSHFPHRRNLAKIMSRQDHCTVRSFVRSLDRSSVPFPNLKYVCMCTIRSRQAGGRARAAHKNRARRNSRVGASAECERLSVARGEEFVRAQVFTKRDLLLLLASLRGNFTSALASRQRR